MGKRKQTKQDCSSAAYIYVMTGQLAEMAAKENLPALAHILQMAQQEAAEAGMQKDPRRARLNS
jgi:hypothetical protein